LHELLFFYEYRRYLFKIVFLANKGIGVHSTLARLTGTQANLHDPISSTPGIPQEEKRHRVVTSDGKEYEFWFHETAGQEIFRGKVTTSYFRHAQAIIYAYDETDAQSFSDVANWMIEANRCNADDTIKFLIGTKNDLIAAGTPRAVSDAQVQEKADIFMTNPMHVSALTGAGCEEAFSYITQYLLQNAKPQRIVSGNPMMDDDENTSKKSPSKKQEKKSKCMV